VHRRNIMASKFPSSDDGSDPSCRRRISTRSWTSSGICALAGMGFNVTPIHLLVVLKGRTLDARLHSCQLMDLPMYIFTRNHLHQGLSKGVPRHTSVPRNFWTVPREKVLGKCEHTKKRFVY